LVKTAEYAETRLDGRDEAGTAYSKRVWLTRKLRRRLTMATAQDCIQQAAVVPIRDGQICLVTSRNGKRWVIPKGCMKYGKTVGETALQEAWEEAGLLGMLGPKPVGSYLYEKSGMTHHVTVFCMRVTRMASAWPESSVRQRRWLRAEKAHARIENLGLRKLLRKVLAEELMELSV